ncbi:MAG TPA: hypothetical protein VFW40_07445, partial [Capsulimonadaceae bacterium]|nr:hypothetical protein [Capsulimonadaceae bacterium]
FGRNAQVQLFWNTDANIDPNAGYNLYRSTTSGGEGGTPYQTNLPSPQFFDNDVSQGTQYFYQVTGINPDATETAKSYEVTATPMMALDPSGLSATPNPIRAGKSATVTVSLALAATVPTTAFLTSDNPNVTFANPNLTVPATDTSANFTINTVNTGNPYSVTVTASENGTDASTTLTVNVPPVLHTFLGGLQMVSAPTDDTGETLPNLFAQNNPPLAAWNGTQYAISPTAPADTLRSGQGYWTHPAIPVNLYDIGADTNSTQPFSVSLVAGWNMIGDPFNAPVLATDLQVKSGASTLTFANGNKTGLVGDTFYTWQPGDAAYEVLPASSSSLQPFEGYWLFAFQPCTLIFPAGG